MAFAIKSYDNPQAQSMDEIAVDLDRIKYLKRLFRRYLEKGELKERLILNHIITFYNVFGVHAATRMLFMKVEDDLWFILKTFLVFLNYMPQMVRGICGRDIISSDVTLDLRLVDRLRKI
jgi:hypothetical protein